MALPGGMSQMGLGITISARDLASGPMTALRGNFTNMTNSVRRGAAVITGGFAAIAGGAAAMAAGMAVLRGSFGLAEIAGQFEQTMVSVGAISRATTEELGNLREAAVQAGIATQFSPREAAEGLQSLAAAGQNANAAIGTLRPVLDLAAGSLGQLGVAQSAEAVVGTLNAYGLAAEDAANVTDRLLRITQLSNFQTRDFQTGLARAAATGAQYGTSLDDVLITMGLLRNANIEASVASTALREAMRRVTTDAGSLQRLQRLGVRSFDEQTGAARSALDIMQDVAQATREMTDEERSSTVSRIFGVRGLLAFNGVAQAQNEVVRDGERVMLRGREAIENYRRELGNATGTAETFREAVLSTFQGQMVLLQGTLETLQTTIGATFGEIFRPLVLAVTESINRFIRVWVAIPRALQIGIGVITLLTAAFSVFGGAVLMVVGIAAVLVVMLGEVLLVVAAVSAGIIAAMAPVIAMWGALVGVAFLVRRAYEENLGGVADFVNSWADRISLAWRAVTEIFAGRLFSDALMEELGRAENEGVFNFVTQVQRGFERATELWNGFVEGVTEAWQATEPVWQELRAALQTLFEEIGRTFGPESALIQAGNQLPTDEFREFGKTLGGDVGQGIRIMVIGLVQLALWTTRAFQLFQAIRPTLEAIGQVFIEIGRAVATLAGWLWRIWDVFRRIQRVLTVFMPIADLIGGASLGEAFTGDRQFGEFGRGPLAGISDLLTSGATIDPGARARSEEMVRMRRDQRDRERADDATLAAYGGRDNLSPDIAQFLLERSAEERGAGRDTSGQPITVNLQVDGETLATRTVRAGEDRGAELGQTVLPDEF